jgi:hypothetical protein
MAALKELLVGTAGMAHLGRTYADGVQTNKIDSDSLGLSIGDLKVFAHRGRLRGSTVDPVSFTLERDSSSIELESREARSLFGVLYGALSAEFDEPVDDGQQKPVPPSPLLGEAVELVRAARLLLNTAAAGDPENSWLNRAEVLLAKFPGAAA